MSASLFPRPAAEIVTVPPRGTSPAREAFALPFIFITVAFLGGFRMRADGAGMEFLPPPLVCLVLAVIALGVMMGSRLLCPERLVGGRGALPTANGVVVLLSLFAATAQVLNGLAPEKGLLHGLYVVFVAVLLWNTAAARPDRARVLRSLMVILGSAFVLKYVALEGLYDPERGLTRRVLTALLEGVALGTLEYQPFAPVTGYVAFFTVLLYMTGLVLLPRDEAGTETD